MMWKMHPGNGVGSVPVGGPLLNCWWVIDLPVGRLLLAAGALVVGARVCAVPPPAACGVVLSVGGFIIPFLVS